MDQSNRSKARHAQSRRPFHPRSRPRAAQSSLPFAPHLEAWNEAQTRLEASLGAPLRQPVRERARMYTQQLWQMRTQWQQLQQMRGPSIGLPTKHRVREVPEGMSTSTIQIGPVPRILFPKPAKHHLREVGLVCGDRPLNVGYVRSMECPEHGFYTYVFFRNSADMDIALRLDSDNEEENCVVRHETMGTMVPVTGAPDGASDVQLCCDKATRAFRGKATKALRDKAKELYRNPSDGDSASSAPEEGEIVSNK